MTQMELYSRSSLSESDFTRAFHEDTDHVLKCPECGVALPSDMASCPNCTTMKVAYNEAWLMDADSSVYSESAAAEITDEIIGPYTGSAQQSLFSACREGHVATVEEILRDGIEVDCRDANDCTPLMEAAVYGQSEVVECLLSYGADVNAQDLIGANALSKVSQTGNAT
jgi:hypothetical protein